jgi:hypothetical protein
MTSIQALTTRRLLRQLATPPASTDPALRENIAALTYDIRSYLQADDDSDAPSIAVDTLHQWRTRLDRALAEFEKADPHAWAHALKPGTWLDNHLRLRSVLAHEVAKAYWDGTTDISYMSIDVERYLWGAR